MTEKAVALSFGDQQWFAVHVRSNQEKVVQTCLQAKGYLEFLPVYRKRNRWSDRVKDVALPLFPGYIFSCFDVYRRLPILTIPAVINIVGAGRTPVPVDEAELDAIRLLIASGRPITPWPFLQIGDRVLIERGALQGIEGILVQTKSRSRLVVSVGLLQRSVAVEIDGEAVRPVSSWKHPSVVCTQRSQCTTANRIPAGGDTGSVGRPAC